MCITPSHGDVRKTAQTDTCKRAEDVKWEENVRGAVVCVLGMGAFVCTDALGKYAVAVLGLPVLQFLSVRGVGMIFCLSVLTEGIGPELLYSLTRRDGLLLLSRMVLEVFSSWFFNLGLAHLPMSMATAIVQALPLAVMIGAAIFGEPIGAMGWLLAAVGFVGVLVVVQPSADGINPWMGCTLMAVLCMATRDIATRSLSARVPSSFIALAGAVGMAGFSAVLSWLQHDEWRPLLELSAWREWSCLVGAMLTGSAGFLSSVLLMRIGSVAFVRARRSLRRAATSPRCSPDRSTAELERTHPRATSDTSTAESPPTPPVAVAAQVQPFRYTLLLWASLLGWLVFSEVPDAHTIAGSVLLVGAGYCSVRTEADRRKSPGAKPVDANAPSAPLSPPLRLARTAHPGSPAFVCTRAHATATGTAPAGALAAAGWGKSARESASRELV